MKWTATEMYNRVAGWGPAVGIRGPCPHGPLWSKKISGHHLQTLQEDGVQHPAYHEIQYDA